MADDPVRLRAFKSAISAVVGQGAVVLDAGCGLGTYAVLAARAGAARVYAIDDGPILEVARQVVEQNDCAHLVHLVRGRTTQLEPQERADVVIFEDYVAGLLLPPVAETVRDLCTRWLKPGGMLLPSRARLLLAPVESLELHRALARFDGTGDRVVGVDLSAAKRYAVQEPQMLSLRPATLLADPALIATLELAVVETARMKGIASVIVYRDGEVHGVAIWFELELAGTTLGTGPLDPPSAWRQVVLPVSPPHRVSEGETLLIDVEAAPLGLTLVWRWQLRSQSGAAQHSSLDVAALAAR